MADETTLYNTVAPLRNVVALVELTDRVQNRGVGLPGMATFYGPSGYGKTSAAVYAANRFRAYSVQVKSAWTAKKLCGSILTDLGLNPARTVADMIDQIAEEIARSGRPLFIDEADFLVSRNMIEIVRDIYESSGATIILIGEELLPQKLRQWERVHGRMLDWVAAQPGDIDDVRALARIYCPQAEIDAETAHYVLTMAHASIRRISVCLDRVREYAVTHGTRNITKADWSKINWFTGHAPAPRKISA